MIIELFPKNDIIHDMRVVYDTDVMLSGLRSPNGASRILLIAAWQGIITPLASVSMMIEYEAALKRPEHLVEMGIDAVEVNAFLDNWASVVEPVVPHFSYRPSIHDPNDEMFVDVAMNGGAAALVTFNLKDYQPTDPQATQIGIDVCRPGDFLRRLQWRPAPDMLSVFRPQS